MGARREGVSERLRARVYRYANVGTSFIKSDDLLRLMQSELTGTYAHAQCQVYSC